jgi:hypothetical protein
MWTFYRWIPKAFAEAALVRGLTSHNGSAMWVFATGGENTYRPGDGITKGAWLLAYDINKRSVYDNILTVRTINFESPAFDGEGKHPLFNILKENERGAVGIGVHRQKTTTLHLHATRFATKKEVATALGHTSEMNVSDNFRPGKTWPK